MFTKTGLRPRELRRRGASLEPLTGIGPKLPPVTATARHGFRAGTYGASATPRMLRARRQTAMARFPPVSILARRGGAGPGAKETGTTGGGVAGRDFAAWGVLPSSSSSTGRTGGSKSAGRGRSSCSVTRGRRVETYRHGGRGGPRSRSAGRVKRGPASPRSSRPIRTRPEWDDSLTDTSQYRLTPEEALRRKISLVSKHNTLVFGLGGGASGGGGGGGGGGGSPEKAAASRRADRGAERGRSSSKEVEQQKQRRRSPRVRAGGAAAADDDEQRKVHKNARSSRGANGSVFPIYGCGGGGGGGRKEQGAAAPEPAAPAADADLTAVGEEGGEKDQNGTGGVSVNDATMTLYPRRGDGDASTGEAFVTAPAAASRRLLSSGSRNRVKNVSGRGGGGGGGAGEEIDGLSCLTGIEEGIEAFSKRVGRLEACRGDGLLTAEKRREHGAHHMSKKEAGGPEQGGCCRGSRSDEEASLCLERPREGSTAGVSPVLFTADVADSGSGTDVSAADGSESGERESRSRGGPRKTENPWSRGAPSSPPSSREPRLPQGGPVEARLFSVSDEGQGTVDLVKRFQQLESQVLHMSSPDPSATNAEEEGAAAEGVKSGRELRESAAARKEERMRAVIADLLSLSASLLERATTAEQRLRDAAGCGCVRKNNGGIAGDDLDHLRGSVLGHADAVAHPAGGSGSKDSPPPTPTTTTKKDGSDTVVSAAAATACASPRRGRTPKTFDPRTLSSPRWRTPQRSTAAEDCWGEALDVVGRLVDGQPFGVHPEEGDSVVAVTASVERSPSPPSVPMLSPPPPPPQDAAGDAAYLGRRGAARQRVDPHASPAQDPAPVDSSTGAALADSFLGDTVFHSARFGLSPRAAAAAAGQDEVGRREMLQQEEDEEEETLRALPVTLAPTPSRKPRHPFGGGRRSRSPPMRSPQWLRSHVGGQAAMQESCVAGSEGRGGFSPREPSVGNEGRGRRGSGVDVWEHRRQGGGDGGTGGGKVATAAPPIGQWYTPALTQE